MITAAKAAQREIVRAEVIHARFQIRERPAHDVHIDVVEGSRTGRSTEVMFLPARIDLLSRDSGCVVEQPRKALQIRCFTGRRYGLVEIPRQRDRIQGRVDLER